MLAVGDLVPGGRVEQSLRRGSSFLSKPVAELFQQMDNVLYNLEAPLTSAGSPIAKCGPNLRVDPEVAKGLANAGFNIACLANNHIFDYGPQGLSDTIAALEDQGVRHHGAGIRLSDAQKAIRFEIQDQFFSFFNIAEGEFCSYAIDRGGGAAPLDMDGTVQRITQAKKDGDMVIVTVHAGNEHIHFPAPWLQAFYHRLIDAGADALIGHHPHVPQGIEVYGQGAICYSLGDFMFDYALDPGTCITFACELHFSRSGLSYVGIHPMEKTSEAILKFLEPTAQLKFHDYFARLCAPLADTEKTRLYWEQGIMRKFDKFYAPKMTQNTKRSHPVGDGSAFASTFLYNMLDCKSHREALKHVYWMISEGRYKQQAEGQKDLGWLDDYLTSYEQVVSTPENGSRMKTWVKKILGRT